MIAVLLYALAVMVGVIYPTFVWLHVAGLAGAVLALLGHAIGAGLIWLVHKKMLPWD